MCYIFVRYIVSFRAFVFIRAGACGGVSIVFRCVCSDLLVWFVAFVVLCCVVACCLFYYCVALRLFIVLCCFVAFAI